MVVRYSSQGDWMIEFEANGWDFETSEDICYALEEVCKQLRDGYRGGYLGNLSWDISGEEECYCSECDEVIRGDVLDPDKRMCDSCFEKEFGEDK
jgi:hypothetical protein